MAGIQKGSSDNLTSPIPHLLNADYLTAAARLAAGQVHYAGRDYYQRDTDIHYRLRALGKCFAADGTTPATMPGTWGTLEAHWLVGAVAGTNGTNGTNGNRILSVSAVPALSDGGLDDLAIVSGTGDLYEKTSSGWALRGNLRGPAGTGGTGGTGSAGVSSFNSRTGSVTLTAADVLAVVNNANQLAGGLHSAISRGAMTAIAPALRDYGMTVVVYADPTAANNGRYDLATDLLTWVKQGAEATGQFAAYNAAVLYNLAAAYVTYPDPTTRALRIFHSLAQTAPATQPAPVSSANALDPAWEEISPSAVTATVAYVQNSLAPASTTKAPSVDAVNTALGFTASTFIAGVITRYATYADAETALPAGGGVILLTGFHDSVQLRKSGVVLRGGLLGELVIGYGTSGSQTYDVDTTVLGRFVVCGTKDGTPIFVNARVATTATTYFESFTFYADPASRNTVNLWRTLVRSTIPYVAPANGTQGSGLIRGQERNYEGSTAWNLRGGDFTSLTGPIASGYFDARSRINLYDGVTLTPGPGKPLQEAILLNGPIMADAELFVDYRTNADTFAVLPYGTGSIAVDFNAASVRTLAATGNVAFTAAANIALLKTKELYITNTTGAAITLSFPAGWSFFPGPAPTSLAAGKQAVLTLRSLGTTDSTIKAAFVAQA